MKLTDEQIEEAAKVLWSNQRVPWSTVGDSNRETFRLCIRVAAPFLQMSWAEPTSEEIHAAKCRLLDTPWNVRDVLTDFVRRRNHALLPKPVDPRREKIKRVLAEYPDRAPEFADKIIEALDAK